MFRSIQSRVIRRSENIKNKTTHQEELQKTIKEFLLSVFGDTAYKIEIAVKIENGGLFIRTANKIVANEIVFHSRALYDCLNNKGIKCNKIIIQ